MVHHFKIACVNKWGRITHHWSNEFIDFGDRFNFDARDAIASMKKRDDTAKVDEYELKRVTD